MNIRTFSRTSVFWLTAAKKISRILAVFIIIFAVLITVTEVLTPILNKHRKDFENWASTLLNTQVTIDEVEASWYRYQPEINLNGVTIYSRETKEPILQVQTVRIFFSIPKSLWQRKPLFSAVMLSGADINLHQSPEGAISVQGFPVMKGFKAKPFKKEAKFTDVLGWLANEPGIILQDINVLYTEANGQTRAITLYKFTLENDNDRHAIHGKAILHQALPTELNVDMNWMGSADFSKIKGKVFLYVTGLSLKEWLAGHSWHDWQINQGIVSAKIWASWESGRLKKIQSIFQGYNLDVFSKTDKTTHRISRVSGHLGWKKQDNSFVLAGDDILIDFPTHLWPVTSFYFAGENNATGSLTPKVINIGYMDLKDVQTFLHASPKVLSEDTKKILSDLQLRGALSALYISFPENWEDWNHLLINTHFSNISFLPWGKYPGVQHFSGNIKWDGKQGELTLLSQNLRLKANQFLSHPLALNQLGGVIDFRRDQDALWSFDIPKLHLANNDLSADLHGKVTTQKDHSPYVDLEAKLSMQELHRLTQYLPAHMLDDSLVKWLKDAFVTGIVSSATANVKGQLEDFPFEHGNGTFLVTANIDHTQLHYAPSWPNLQDLKAKITFSGKQMSVDATQLQILDIPIHRVFATIPDLGGDKPFVFVTTNEIETDFSNGIQLLHQSPLEDSIGKMFSGMTLTGPIGMTLALTVPLFTPENTIVRGDVNIKNGQMNIVPWDLALHDLKGKFIFTENKAEAQNIDGLLFNKPIQIHLSTIEKSNNAVIRANIKNNLAINDLENWLKIPLDKVATGSADVNGEIDFSTTQPMEVRLESNLVGTTVQLPDQYAKKAEEPRHFGADIIGANNQPLKVRINYGNDLLSAALLTNRVKRAFALTAANVHFGNGVAEWPKANGLYVTADFDELDWAQVSKYVDPSTQKTNALPLPLKAIDVDAKKFDLMGQSLTNVHVEVEPTKDSWKIDLESREADGKIEIPQHFSPQEEIIAKFKKLDLIKSASTETLTSINIKNLPAITFTANNVNYNHISLGQLDFKTQPIQNGLSISNLTIQSSRMFLQASGVWLQEGNRNSTHLQGKAYSNRVTDLLNSFDIDARNFISSKGHINFDLNWLGAPYSPSIGSLSGRAAFELGHGRVVDIGQEAGAKMDIGRMLSIFSLQTIPRRLSLDFSDLVQKGYSFDSVRGDFAFQHGDAFTNNLYFNGPVAGVNINGRIGFKDKDYDFTLSVTPRIALATASLPVAATLMGVNPIVGVAALAANTIIGTGVSKAATHYYQVSGPWSNPNWQSLSNGPHR